MMPLDEDEFTAEMLILCILSESRDDFVSWTELSRKVDCELRMANGDAGLALKSWKQRQHLN